MVVKTNFRHRFLVTSKKKFITQNGCQSKKNVHHPKCCTFTPENAVISNKKGLRLKSVYDFLLFVLNLRFSLKSHKNTVFVLNLLQISSQTSNVSDQVQRYLPHRAIC